MRKPELPALTGIRFFAAMLVYLSHLPVLPGIKELTGERLVFNAGAEGVAVFFVLSGFILTYNYGDVFREKVGGIDYRRFVWDRWTKIYPVHLLALLVILPLAIWSPNAPLDWRVVPMHLALLQCWWPLPEPKFYYDLNVPSWSISCEWFFYLLAPVAIYLALGGARRWFLLTLVGAYLAGLWYWVNPAGAAQQFHSVELFAPTRMVDFVVGVFVARLFLRDRFTQFVQRKPVVALLLQWGGVGAIVAGALYRESAPWLFWGGLLYVPGAAALVLGLACGRGFLVAFLGNKLLRILGTVSFSFYMIHAPILRAMRAVLQRLGWHVHSWLEFAALALLLLAGIQVVAAAICYRYELPVQSWLRKRFRRKPAVGSAMAAWGG